MSNVIQESVPFENQAAARLANLKDRKKEFEEKLRKIVISIKEKGGDEKIKVGTLKGLYKDYLLRWIKDRLKVTKFPAVKNLYKDYRKLGRHELTLTLCTEGLRDAKGNEVLPAFTRSDLLSCRNYGKSCATISKIKKESGETSESDQSDSESDSDDDKKKKSKKRKRNDKKDKRSSKRQKATDTDVEDFLQQLADDVALRIDKKSE
jgi:hypothetical protein